MPLYFDVTKGKGTFRNSLYNGAGYNGWKAHDNPFLVRPKKDGIFNIDVYKRQSLAWLSRFAIVVAILIAFHCQGNMLVAWCRQWVMWKMCIRDRTSLPDAPGH